MSLKPNCNRLVPYDTSKISNIHCVVQNLKISFCLTGSIAHIRDIHPRFSLSITAMIYVPRVIKLYFIQLHL